MRETVAGGTDQAEDRIGRYLSDRGLSTRDSKVVPLTGDASDRRYFRVRFGGGESIVLALHAGPITFRSLPFANVAALLGMVPLPIPAILGHSDHLGIIELQDLGDVTLQAHLGAASPTQHMALYREAVDCIERLQRRGSELASDSFLPYRTAFDIEKLTWELNYFVSHFLQSYRGIELSASERRTLDEEWASIAAELAAEPRVLCHRDYHSRNLMLYAGCLHVIDFQDARLGPETYDLASLLRDSYVDLGEVEIEDLIAHFLALRGRSGGDRDDFRRRFDLMAVQRNLKALGTFGYQASARGNPVYIQYMPRTLEYVRANLARYGRFHRLRNVLAGHLDELR